MNIEDIRKRVESFKHDWEVSRQCCDVEDFSDDVLTLISLIDKYKQENTVLRETFEKLESVIKRVKKEMEPSD